MLKGDAISSLEKDPEIFRLAEIVEAALSAPGTPLNFQGTDVSLASIWDNLRGEVYELLCTKSPKYRKERELFSVTAKPAIAVLATSLTGGFGLPIAAASGLASLALLLPFKMVTQSWCKLARSPTIRSEELAQLKQLSKMSGMSTQAQTQKKMDQD